MRRRELLIFGSIVIAFSPAAARTQQKAMPVIGYLHFGSAKLAPTPAVFLQGLILKGENQPICRSSSRRDSSW